MCLNKKRSQMFQNLTISKTRQMLLNKEISVKELVTYYLKNIETKNKDINAYLEVFDNILSEAEKMDEDKERLDGRPLFGVPLAIKDNILIKGKNCSAGSKMLEKYMASYDATVIKKLKDAGAILIGRTNMDEFAMGASTENSAYGITKNPHDTTRVAGGSSGGSAAAVAMGGCLAALGSDTGGSIRQPASFCGVVGLNPTYGSVSRSGLIAMASSFDQIGPITGNTEDAEIIFNVIKGKDTLDSTSKDASLKEDKNKTGKKFRIGVLKYDKNGVDGDVNEKIEESIEIFKKFGYEISEVDLPNAKYAVPCYYVLVPAEISSNLARFDGVRYGLLKEGKNLMEDYMTTRAAGFGTEVKRRIMLGAYVLSSGYYDDYYLKAQQIRALIKNDFQKTFDLSAGGVDLVVSPVSPSAAFKIGERTNDPLKMYLEDIFTAPAKMAGLPAISIPSYRSRSQMLRDSSQPVLPIGIQLIAPRWGEKLLFDVGKKYESFSRGS